MSVTETAHVFSDSARRRIRWLSVSMVCGSLAAICGFGGLILGLIPESILTADGKPVEWISTALSIIAFPLLALTAHAIDKVASLNRHSHPEQPAESNRPTTGGGR